MEKFLNRQQAGIALAEKLKAYFNKPDTFVLALPRGGVPVAYEIAKTLSLPLDVFIVRKLGVPGHEELAMGAIATGGSIYYNNEIIQTLHINEHQIQEVIQSEKKELKRRENLYNKKKNNYNFNSKTIILVDDGIATGATMLAALNTIKKQNPAELIIAVPVAAYSTYIEFSKKVDRFICLLKPVNFYAVGLWYQDFTQTTDSEVAELLKQRP